MWKLIVLYTRAVSIFDGSRDATFAKYQTVQSTPDETFVAAYVYDLNGTLVRQCAWRSIQEM